MYIVQLNVFVKRFENSILFHPQQMHLYDMRYLNMEE